MRFIMDALQPDPEKQRIVEGLLEEVIDRLQAAGVEMVALVARDEGGVSIAAGAARELTHVDVADFLLSVGHDYQQMMR
jgi:hypothetical protein